MEGCTNSVTEGNIIEGFDNPIVDIGGANNTHQRNIFRRKKKP